MHDKNSNKSRFDIRKALHTVLAVLFTAFMLALFILFVIYREQITADQITKFTPANKIAAVLFMLLIFAVKSFCVFIYCGILYAASGIIFPIPYAILVNILGTVIMTSIPYFIGKKAGGKYIEKLLVKHPKLDMLNEAHGATNSFFLSFTVRITGLLPSDIVSAFFGASGVSYGAYIISTILGFLPMIGAFSVMGMSAHDVTSPTFLTAAGVQLGIMLLSCILYIFIRKKKTKRNV